jgi:hypothetical protein
VDKTLSLPSNYYHEGFHPKILGSSDYFGAAPHPRECQLTGHAKNVMFLLDLDRYIVDD